MRYLGAILEGKPFELVQKRQMNFLEFVISQLPKTEYLPSVRREWSNNGGSFVEEVTIDQFRFPWTVMSENIVNIEDLLI